MADILRHVVQMLLRSLPDCPLKMFQRPLAAGSVLFLRRRRSSRRKALVHEAQHPTYPGDQIQRPRRRSSRGPLFPLRKPWRNRLYPVHLQLFEKHSGYRELFVGIEGNSCGLPPSRRVVSIISMYHMGFLVFLDCPSCWSR